MQTLRRLVLRVARGLQWLPPTLTRLVIGVVFVQSGWGKLHNLEKVVGFFTQLGIPAPGAQARLVACTELVCGALILVGLATRIATIPLMITMAVALLTALRSDIHGLSDLFGVSEFLYIALLAWLGAYGAGPVSLDRVVAGRMDEGARPGAPR